MPSASSSWNRWLGALAGLALGACGGATISTGQSDGGNGDGGGAPMSFDAYCNALYTALPEMLARCRGGPVDAWAEVARASFSCDDLQAAIDAGRQRFDGTQAQACLDSFQSLPCSELGAGNQSPACVATFSGAVDAGGSCVETGDCADEGICNLPAGSCAGTCQARLAAGAPCQLGDSCVAGSSCSATAGQPGSCQPDPAPASLDQSCAGGTPCEIGLNCDAVTQTCVQPLAEGAPCTPYHRDCALVLYCDPQSSTCKRWGNAGDPCGLYFDAQQQNFEYAGCLGATFCDVASGQQTGTCAAKLADDAGCTAGGQCLSSRCNAGTAVCDPTCHE